MPSPRISRSLLLWIPLVCLVTLPSRAADGPAAPLRRGFESTGRPTTPSENVLERAAATYLPLSERLSPDNGYPRSIIDGVDWRLTAPRTWTSGFLAGILWQLYGRFEDEALLEQARRWTEDLAAQTSVPSHDVGLIIGTSFGRGYRAAGTEWYRTVALEAAEQLADRFDPRVGAIRSWGAVRPFTYPVIIDNLITLEILFWAARNGGDASLADVARTHAMTTMRDHVRADGTTFHLVDYDPETGDVLWRGTVQGLADTSTWSRGQAWGLYGFALAHRETGEPLLLETARRVADAFLARLPEDGIPCWDFDAASIPGEPKDAAAAAIAASGLWDLASLIEDEKASDRYRAASVALVERLSSSDYSAEAAGLPALLLHSTGNRPMGDEVDVPLIYAEYYFVEALIRQASAGESGIRTAGVRSYPNPFHAETRIAYELPRQARVTLRIYDVSGRRVRELLDSRSQDQGPQAVPWDGRDEAGRAVASGVYLCRLMGSGKDLTGKMVLLR